MMRIARAARFAVAIALAWLFALHDVGAQTPATEQAQLSAAELAANPADVELFENKVRPLLVARCQGCHGSEKQKGGLRLDSREAVLKGGDTSLAIVPGKPEESLLVDAIRYGDSYQMPPKSQLPAEEIATLVEWVRLGAPWGREEASPSGAGKSPAPFDLTARAGHWSLQPVAAIAPPQIGNARWIQTPVDRFILARLESAGLTPAPAANKRTLLRRVTFDLIGLLPTPGEIDAFLADESPAAFEKVVDRLLSSPHYGERRARHWLDLVRFAETYGHEFDFEIPNAYRYRDYVIRAFNADLPYDQFVIEHVAGDLLPAPRRHPLEGFNESVIATGGFFLGEAKHSPVDVRQDEADRIDNQIDVFGKTFLGLTLACARCHDHKFDAISTKDYYALAGYLQSSRCRQAYIDAPEPLDQTTSELKALGKQRAEHCLEFAGTALQPRLANLAATLLAELGAPSNENWAKYLRETAQTQVDDVLHPWARLTQKPAAGAADNFAERRAQLAAQLKEQRNRPSAADALVFADFSAPGYSPWQTDGAAFGSQPGEALAWGSGPRGRFPNRLLAERAAHSGLVSSKLRGSLRSPTFTIEQPKIFYRVYGTGGQVRLILDGLLLISNPIYGGLQFDAGGEQPHWHEQDVSKWIGQRAYIEVNDPGDGYLALERVVFAAGAAPEARPNQLVAAMLDDPAVTSVGVLAERYQSLLQQICADWLAEPARAGADASDRGRIIQWILEQQIVDPQLQPAQEQDFQAKLAPLAVRQQQLEATLAPPKQAIALADGTPENERVFIRGSHKTLGDEVPRRFLEVMGGARHPTPEHASGRLELAQQMVSEQNPLLRRVIVNRLWQHHFGEGIVRSPDDFGVMGQPPTHPELLDYLATELVREGWSLKAMHRLMLLSSTYQMASPLQSAADGVDPQNKLLHRMTVRRLESECIRDAMLAVSGRADFSMYGPSVLPNLTPYMTGRGRPKDSGPLDGDGRRSIYLGVRRNFLSPMFLAFDYPIPFSTIGRRSASNVPAQALTMLNNPFVVEQARRWAARVLSTPGQTDRQRIHAMYVTAFSRPPDEAEQQAALDFLGPAGEASASGDSRAWADLAHVLFNVKEFIFVQQAHHVMHCGRFLAAPLSRREMLVRSANGFGALALAALSGDRAFGELATAATSEGAARLNPLAPRTTHFPAKAKNVIFLFMDGGPSQVDTFDPKPRLAREHGQPIKMKVQPTQFDNVGKVLQSPWEFHQHGQSGIPVSDLFPHLATCVDDLAIVRSMVSNFSEHTNANYFIHSGFGQQGRPSLGAWATYGLGSQCQNLPGFVVLNSGMVPPGGWDMFNNGFLPATFQGSSFQRGEVPVADLVRGEASAAIQNKKLDLMRALDHAVLARTGADDKLESAIVNYELAFRMQTAVPDLMDLAGESESTKQLYGIDDAATEVFGRQCLVARRLVERGVRFVELLCQNLGYDRWDQHSNLKEGHAGNARATDKPIAGLLKDLKARGLLDETLVLWGGEFGRTPMAQGTDGRDHNPFGFTMWLAGGGIKGGTVHGATDEYGYYAIENKVPVHDLHATMLHLLGMDHKRLTYRFGGRDMRLTDVHGEVVKEILS